LSLYYYHHTSVPYIIRDKIIAKNDVEKQTSFSICSDWIYVSYLMLPGAHKMQFLFVEPDGTDEISSFCYFFSIGAYEIVNRNTVYTLMDVRVMVGFRKPYLTN
jgi:hypothetical protein